MKKAIPMTGSSVTVTDPDLEKFRATIARLWQQSIDSGKVRLPVDSAFIRQNRAGADPISEKTAAAISEFREELNAISPPPEPAPFPVVKAPPPRRGPPQRPPLKRPSASK